MKKSLLFIGMSIFSLFTFAQTAIVINHNDFNFPLTPDTARGREAVLVSIVPPTEGQNQTWNYSNLQNSQVNNFSLSLPGANPLFPTATGKRNVTQFLGPLLISGITEYYANDSTSIKLLGNEIDSASYSLASQTGGANDWLNVMKSNHVFGDSVERYEFPLQMGANWQNNYEMQIDFTAEVNLVGLQGDTGKLRQFYTEHYEVVGWGSVNLPNSLGSHEALLLKTKIQWIDSLYLNGAPADPFLLLGLGLTQGFVNDLNVYEILIRGLNRPAIIFETDTAYSSVYYVNFCTDVSTFGIDEENRIETKVYPNPSANGLVRVEFFKAKSSAWKLSVFNNLGVVVHQEMIPEGGSIKRQIQLQETSGIYFYSLEDDLGNRRAYGKIVLE